MGLTIKICVLVVFILRWSYAVLYEAANRIHADGKDD